MYKWDVPNGYVNYCTSEMIMYLRGDISELSSVRIVYDGLLE